MHFGDSILASNKEGLEHYSLGALVRTSVIKEKLSQKRACVEVANDGWELEQHRNLISFQGDNTVESMHSVSLEEDNKEMT